ncbi:hypothetical protein DBV05_g2402 [Lasiodiplodia theobromae]|uniref:Uncharacterized protein n=1 Tax=Lasiodiplodia theobromae TaxID=45133 RepID=A0A5N5DNP5_9PEZI|nr:hypothetical protein DBV05_g2402 [Lasiodiplodia theobromae]
MTSQGNMAQKIPPYVRASKSQQPFYSQQRDFGSLDNQEYYPYTAGYYSPPYGYYYYYPQYQQPMTEEAIYRTNGRTGGLRRGTHSAPLTAPTAGTPKKKPHTKDGRNDNKKHHEDDEPTNELAHLVTHINLREQVVLPYLKDEAWNLYDMAMKADSQEESDTLAMSIIALGGAVEVMESALDFDYEQLRELLHSGESGSECSSGNDEEDPSFLGFLLRSGFPGYGQDSEAKPEKFCQETQAARPTGYATRKTAAVGREGRSRPRRNDRVPETYKASFYREV